LDKIVVLKITMEELEDAIPSMSELKPILQEQVRRLNGKNKAQGEIDAKELGKHFETAINSMITIWEYMDANSNKN
jgi:hypothetical protein